MHLPEDTWIYLLENHLDNLDIARLSRTCRSLRVLSLPYVFRRLTIRGHRDAAQSKSTLPAYLDYLGILKKRIKLLESKPDLLLYIREVEVSHWFSIPYRKLFLTYVRPEKVDNNIIWSPASEWSSAYEAVIKLITQLRCLRKIRFLECEEASHLHLFFACDRGPLGAPETPQSSHTFCTGIEFEIGNPGKLFEFQAPPALISLLGASTNLIEQKYYPYLIDKFPGTLTSAKLQSFFLDLSKLPVNSRLFSLRRLGIEVDNILRPEVIAAQLAIILELLPKCPHIRVLETNVAVTQLPAQALPNLECLSGPLSFVTSIVAKRPVHTVQVKSCGSGEKVTDLEKLKLSAVTVHTIDLTGMPLTGSDLPQIATALPQIENLIIPWIQDITVSDLETMLRHCLELLEPFKEVKIFRAVTVPQSSIRFDLPEVKTYLKSYCTHPTLHTIVLGEKIKFVWFEEGEKKGWLFDKPPLEIIARSYSEYIWFREGDRLTRRLRPALKDVW